MASAYKCIALECMAYSSTRILQRVQLEKLEIDWWWWIIITHNNAWSMEHRIVCTSTKNYFEKVLRIRFWLNWSFPEPPIPHLEQLRTEFRNSLKLLTRSTFSILSKLGLVARHINGYTLVLNKIIWWPDVRHLIFKNAERLPEKAVEGMKKWELKASCQRVNGSKNFLGCVLLLSEYSQYINRCVSRIEGNPYSLTRVHDISTFTLHCTWLPLLRIADCTTRISCSTMTHTHTTMPDKE